MSKQPAESRNSNEEHNKRLGHITAAGMSIGLTTMVIGFLVDSPELQYAGGLTAASSLGYGLMKAKPQFDSGAGQDQDSSVRPR